MNSLIIIISGVVGAIVGIPSFIVYRNNKKLKSLKEDLNNQINKMNKSKEQYLQLESLFIPYSKLEDSFYNQKIKNDELDSNIKTLRKKIDTIISPDDFNQVNNDIKKLEQAIADSKQEETILFSKAKPIMDKIEAENRRRQEQERKERLKREEEERIARKKREDEEEEERQARRRRDESSYSSSYSSSSSDWSSSSSSDSSWSGGGGDSSGGGSSDSW